MYKNVSYAFAVFGLTVLIVPPVIGSVNAATRVNTLFSTGQPMPAPTPPVLNDSMLLASGQPMPAPTPPLERFALSV